MFWSPRQAKDINWKKWFYEWSYTLWQGWSVTRPDQTKPDQTKPDQTKPGQTRPEQTRPDQTRPGQARPGQARPGQARPGQARPPPVRAGPRAGAGWRARASWSPPFLRLELLRRRNATLELHCECSSREVLLLLLLLLLLWLLFLSLCIITIGATQAEKRYSGVALWVLEPRRRGCKEMCCGVLHLINANWID